MGNLLTYSAACGRGGVAAGGAGVEPADFAFQVAKPDARICNTNMPFDPEPDAEAAHCWNGRPVGGRGCDTRMDSVTVWQEFGSIATACESLASPGRTAGRLKTV
jgi:hypothetical protein